MTAAAAADRLSISHPLLQLADALPQVRFRFVTKE